MDNHDQPLSIHDGTKLELGSTAKLRTLVTYLEIIADLHRRYASRARQELAVQHTHPTDRLTKWALRYLAARPPVGLPDMLEAALDRRYSASPAETFWTGGAPHTFANFDSADNARVITVRDGFRRSVNLVFIRLMRDIVRFYTARAIESSGSLLTDGGDPGRATYLARFADREGQVFLERFWTTYQRHRPDAVVAQLLTRVRRRPETLAAVHRFIWPQTDVASLTTWLSTQLNDPSRGDAVARRLYSRYAPSRYSLADRAHLVGLHPLNLWLGAYLVHHPQATLDEIVRESAEARQQAYGWLARTRNKRAQDRRIRTMLEVDAFETLHRGWVRLGYPFASLVPSYATAIGSSGDRPAALAELMGIILADGVRLPTIRIEELRFAEGTPYERRFGPEHISGVRVLDASVAATLRQQLRDVVERGTGRRAREAVLLADGTRLVVGGKTGTGDNRVEPPGAHTGDSRSRVLNRTATFVYFIGDRFYGTITAYVPGPGAAEYRFTSALPVQLFTQLMLVLRPMLEQPRRTCAASGSAPTDEPHRRGKRCQGASGAAGRWTDTGRLSPGGPMDSTGSRRHPLHGALR